MISNFPLKLWLRIKLCDHVVEFFGDARRAHNEQLWLNVVIPSLPVRKTLPSGKVVKLLGVADPTRPWEVHQIGPLAAVRRSRRGSSGDYQDYKGGSTVPLVLEIADAERLAALLNARVRKKKPARTLEVNVTTNGPRQASTNDVPSSAAAVERPWRADSLGQSWYVCREGTGALGLSFYVSDGKPQKFDEQAARHMADQLNKEVEPLT